MVPLQLETSRAADQVHVARVVDLKAKLLESRLGVPRVDVQLEEELSFFYKSFNLPMC